MLKTIELSKKRDYNKIFMMNYYFILNLIIFLIIIIKRARFVPFKKKIDSNSKYFEKEFTEVESIFSSTSIHLFIIQSIKF